MSTKLQAGNLFAGLPNSACEEITITLAQTQEMHLDRIVSTGQSTPPNQWYDQPDAEWVVLLKGSAVLRFETEPAARPLTPGDHILIPARTRHRVEATAADEPTVWLALHFGPQS